MNTISISYALVWQIKTAPEYQFTKDGKCFNLKTGKRLKQCYQSRCLGFNIKGKFHSLKKLRKLLTKITENEYTPF